MQRRDGQREVMSYDVAGEAEGIVMVKELIELTQQLSVGECQRGIS